MAKAFVEMLRDCFDASLSTTEEGRQVAQRPLDLAEQAATAIVGSSIAFAADRADEETLFEVINVGIAMAIKFREYLQATGSESTAALRISLMIMGRELTLADEAGVPKGQAGSRAVEIRDAVIDRIGMEDLIA